ncbi:MAG TPA: thiamine pyrophosphate-binding protein [Vicinamibacterales bacterium]|nr:thiamine pyrophosphate-binding protein [Vicinamibacterales bacterium]
MSASGTPDAIAAPAWARGVAAGLQSAGSRDVVYVPDNPLSHVLASLEPGCRTILATREEEAFGIAAGLALGGAKPTVLLQSSGIGNSINALTSLLLAYELPVLMVVSMRGGPGEWNAAQVPMGAAVPRILDAIGIQHASPGRGAEVTAAVRLAAALAFGTRTVAACLIPFALARGLHAPDPEQAS